MNSKQKKRAPLGADTADEGLDLADLVNVAYDRDDSYSNDSNDFDFENRIVSPTEAPEDIDPEASLRPRRLEDYIGQDKVKENLHVYMDAARLRHEPLDHVLLYGPPGLGKTTLSNIIAAEMGVNLRITSGPSIEKKGDLVALLTNLNEGDVLFIDEIHRLPRMIEEILYPAMEDFEVDFVIGKGPTARSIRIDLPKFTLIGATTRAGSLSAPLRDRFGIIFRLQMYTTEELMQIVHHSAGVLGIQAEEDGVREIARRSRGTPRIVNRLLKRVRDYAQVRGDGVITKAMAREALTLLDVDDLGLDRVDRTILTTMMQKFDGRPVGLDTLAATTGEDAVTIEDVVEPYLMQLGFLTRTPRGRVVMPAAYEHLGRKPQTPPDEGEQMRI